MNLPFDDLVYGNSSIEQEKKMDKHLPMMLFGRGFYKENLHPSNSSLETEKELHFLAKKINKVSNQDQLERFRRFDISVMDQFFSLCRKLKVKADESQVTELSNKLDTLITTLKYFYNRPRPHQLAFYLNIDVHPHNTKTTQSPSYPSGHTLKAMIIANYYAEKHPSKSEQFESLAHEIMASREYLGVHYPSDNKFSQKIAKIITKDVGIDKYMEYVK